MIRIDTNQGISGLGEVRDGGSKNYALMLKSRLSARTPAMSTRSSARSSSSDSTPGRPAACAAWRWRCGIWPARPTACRLPDAGRQVPGQHPLYADTTQSNDPKVYGSA
jgi:hypothetical protein